MRKLKYLLLGLLFLVALDELVGLARAVLPINWPSATGWQARGPVTFNQLSIPLTPLAQNGVPQTDGTFGYCSDCGVTGSNICATGGTGSFYQRVSGVWKCGLFNAGTVGSVPDPLFLNRLISIGVTPRIDQYSVNGDINIQSWGAVSSTDTMTCTGTSGTKVLNCTAVPSSFLGGQYIYVDQGMAPNTNLTAPTIASVAAGTAFGPNSGFTCPVYGNADYQTGHGYTTAAADVIVPLTGNANGSAFQVIAACTSGGAAPTWPQGQGTAVTDSGGCQWTNRGPETYIAQAYAATSTANGGGVSAPSAATTITNAIPPAFTDEQCANEVVINDDTNKIATEMIVASCYGTGCTPVIRGAVDVIYGASGGARPTTFKFRDTGVGTPFYQLRGATTAPASATNPILKTSITSISGTTVNINDNLGANVTSVQVGHDNGQNINNSTAFMRCDSGLCGGNFNGGRVVMPAGIYTTATTINFSNMLHGNVNCLGSSIRPDSTPGSCALLWEGEPGDVGIEVNRTGASVFDGFMLRRDYETPVRGLDVDNIVVGGGTGTTTTQNTFSNGGVGSDSPTKIMIGARAVGNTDFQKFVRWAAVKTSNSLHTGIAGYYVNLSQSKSVTMEDCQVSNSDFGAEIAAGSFHIIRGSWPMGDTFEPGGWVVYVVANVSDPSFIDSVSMEGSASLYRGAAFTPISILNNRGPALNPALAQDGYLIVGAAAAQTITIRGNNFLTNQLASVAPMARITGVDPARPAYVEASHNLWGTNAVPPITAVGNVVLNECGDEQISGGNGSTRQIGTPCQKDSVNLGMNIRGAINALSISAGLLTTPSVSCTPAGGGATTWNVGLVMKDAAGNKANMTTTTCTAAASLDGTHTLLVKWTAPVGCYTANVLASTSALTGTGTFEVANTGGQYEWPCGAGIDGVLVNEAPAGTYTVPTVNTTGAIQFGQAVATPGASPTAVLGTTTGTNGPVTASQNSWQPIRLSDGSTAYVPVWK